MKNFFRRSVLIILTILAFLPVLILPELAKAQATDTKIPEFNPLCWEEKACQNIRAQASGLSPEVAAKLPSGWVKDPDTCPGDKWGKCLPAGSSITSITFGGKNKFLHLGDFVQYAYRYAIGIAGILAAVMIVVAGVQWTVSGGNTETITSAKHRISGAIIGLLIAYLSYAILNTLNPALVNLRLPQVWMIRPQSLVPKFCSAAPIGTKFAKAAEATDQSSGLKPPSGIVYNLSFPESAFSPLKETTVVGTDTVIQDPTKYTPDTAPTNTEQVTKQPDKVPDQIVSAAPFVCGGRFYMQNAGATACWGDVCGAGNFCSDFQHVDNPSAPNYSCQAGMLAGNITSDSIVGEKLAEPTTNGAKLIALCKDGAFKKIASENITETNTGGFRYLFQPTGDISSACGSEENILGFYLGLEVNDETSGAYPLDRNASYGIDDEFAIGQQSGPGTHLCNVNLSKIAFRAVYGYNSQCTSNDCTCAFLAAGSITQTLAKKFAAGDGEAQNFVKHLITLDELKKGYQCDVSLSRGDFPAADNKFAYRLLKGGLIGATVATGGLAAAGAAGGVAVGTGAAAIVADSYGVAVSLGSLNWAATPLVFAGGATFAGGFASLSLSDPTDCGSSFAGNSPELKDSNHN